jgi:glycosyltransferase involved in cell wall biosynthesis
MTQSKTDILIASGVRGDTRRYRTIHLFEQCRLLGLDAALSHVTDSEFQNKTDCANLLVLHRAARDPNIEHAIRSIHHRGGKVIYDTDDLLFDSDAFKWIDSPDFSDPVRADLYREDMLRHRQTMEACDAIVTSTDYLARQAASLKLPTFVHRNAFSAEMLEVSLHAAESRNKDVANKTIIGYASGTLTHNRDFESIGPVLRKVMDNHPKVVLWLIGPLKLERGWKEYRSRIIHLPHVPWRLLPAYLSRFDINLAPLVVDNPFSQSKSEIKWMEAALVGVPTVASPTNAYRTSIRNGKSGYLAKSVDEWQAILSDLIEKPNFRGEIGLIAQEQVLQQYNPEFRAGEFLKVLRKVSPLLEGLSDTKRSISSGIQHTSDRAEQRLWEGSYNDQSPSLFTMGLYSLKNRGFTTLVRQVWVFIRRLISPVVPYRKKQIL